MRIFCVCVIRCKYDVAESYHMRISNGDDRTRIRIRIRTRTRTRYRCIFRCIYRIRIRIRCIVNVYSEMDHSPNSLIKRLIE